MAKDLILQEKEMSKEYKFVKERITQGKHETLSYCNMKIKIKLEDVKSMKTTEKFYFECEICTEGKICTIEKERKAS